MAELVWIAKLIISRQSGVVTLPNRAGRFAINGEPADSKQGND